MTEQLIIIINSIVIYLFVYLEILDHVINF